MGQRQLQDECLDELVASGDIKQYWYFEIENFKEQVVLEFPSGKKIKIRSKQFKYDEGSALEIDSI